MAEGLEKLTPRELEVAKAIHRGLRQKEVASALGLSESTIRTYMDKIYTKLDITSATQLVLLVERAKVAQG